MDKLGWRGDGDGDGRRGRKGGELGSSRSGGGRVTTGRDEGGSALGR